MGIRTESVKGQCIIEIRDNEKTLYELNWKLAELADTEYVQVPVDWNFKRDSNYRIVIHLEESEGPVYLRFTKDNVNPMLELGVGENRWRYYIRTAYVRHCILLSTLVKVYTVIPDNKLAGASDSIIIRSRTNSNVGIPPSERKVRKRLIC